MSQTIFVRPAPGRTIKDPLTKETLPAAGALKPRNAFWLRRLRDGDVVMPVLAPASPVASKRSSSTKSSEG